MNYDLPNALEFITRRGYYASMLTVEPPDSHYLSAALGWLELGNPAEALVELEKIAPALLKHPDVLEVCWMIHARKENWDAAAEVARALVQSDPARPSAWLHQAYALRRATGGGLQAAWDVLLPAAEKFPEEATIPYNLSCYACQMQRLDEARVWFQRAMKLGDKHKLNRMALNDPDLKPLWDEIPKL